MQMIGKLLRKHEKAKIKALLSLVNHKSQPNLNALTESVKDLTAAQLSIKLYGYELARKLHEALPIPEKTLANHVGLQTSLSIQDDIESDWSAHWCAELKIPVVYHRKIWELIYILQAIFEEGHMKSCTRALGFGCGEEPIPSYLASLGMRVTMTDLAPEQAQSAGWTGTNQHAASLERAHKPYLVSIEKFRDLVDLQYVDMNAIPSTLSDYDLCWSMCALEHLGSIEKGLKFIENSLVTLRPGGLAVHTTEFNINPEGPTIDNWVTVLFQRRHIEELAKRLRMQGHYVAELNFDLGKKVMDRFIDLPPFHHNMPVELQEWVGEQYHLKLGFDGFVTTCIGIVVRKAIA
ncbi:class I SAM-dependent methyltransferase [Sphingomonas abietis]|uniref:Methyltransferase domain-containing protein n=1 Tax=Sphingomonas abietis TaxID=3012344 RepID=A0ABY7NR64_9SPHN|nr:methyltransferase domain-containing protein [Sphingomonas abietis]WBO22439.1 methyltransferase domain-containing protein [Sphingomonas abietis]